MYVFAHFDMYLLVFYNFFKSFLIFYHYVKFSIITLKWMVMSPTIRLIKSSGVNRPVIVDFKLWVMQQRVKTSPL